MASPVFREAGGMVIRGSARSRVILAASAWSFMVSAMSFAISASSLEVSSMLRVILISLQSPEAARALMNCDWLPVHDEQIH